MSVVSFIQRGVDVIRETLATLPGKPGVYRMLGEGDYPLYVGKAKNLKKRVINYTQVDKLSNRLKRMVSETVRMEIVITKTETEALLLESNLIKKLQPRYNVLLKDDKAFPYLHITSHEYPRLIKYRGKLTEKGKFYGPFASAYAVDATIVSLQKVFLLRNCSDEVFKNRRRPCLQYYIKRCSAPCVGYVSKEGYLESIKQTHDFLRGKSGDVQKFLIVQMESASREMRYEEAATYRDRIKMLTHIQTHQRIHVPDIRDADVFGIAQVGKQICVQVYFYRYGSNYGTESFFLDHGDDDISENLEAFLKLFYVERAPAPTILLSHSISDMKAIQEALDVEHQVKSTWLVPKVGAKADLTKHACDNAMEAIQRKLSKRESFKNLFEDISKVFLLENLPERIEIYDNSHLQGRQAYGVMVVANQEGMDKKSYRKFMIQSPSPNPLGGDDYAMMREVMRRRFSRIQEDGWQKPDLMIIDGGLGQVNAVLEVMEEKGLVDIKVVGMSKGKDRNAGRETFIVPGQPPFKMEEQSPALHLLQRMRDEAHRFGISAHRAAREKNLKKSVLDDIPGIGSVRKKTLLQYFGSAQHVARAALEDLLLVPGIDRSVAQKIYDYFHER